MKNKLVEVTAIALGAMLLVNGLYMLLASESWYWAIPGVSMRGEFNIHFVRDIGIIYSLCGGGLIYGAVRPLARPGMWLFASAWLCGHALFHLWEVASGTVGVASLVEDFMGVTLPAAITVVLVIFGAAGETSAAG